MSPRLVALLLVLSGNMLIDALEVSTLVVALPSIAGELRLTPSAASWLMTGFAAGFGGSVLLGNRLTARFGRRKVYLLALLAFAVASVLSGLTGDVAVLTALRVVKGICVALTVPTGLAIIAGTFPEGPARNRALSVYSLFGASGFAAGLVLSGALTMISWRWTLAFSGPVAFALFLVGLRLIPAGDPPPAPAPGTRGAPVLKWPLLRSAAGAAVLNGTHWVFLLVATFELQARLGATPLATGLALLPTSLPLAFSAMYSGRLIARFGPARLIAAGSGAALAGYAWFLGADPHRSYLVDVLPAVLLVGAAFLLSFSALHVQAVSGAAPGRAGLAGGIYQTSVQLGGAAMLALVAAGIEGSHQQALVVITAVAAAGLLVAVTGTRVPRPAPAPKGEKSWPSARSGSR